MSTYTLSLYVKEDTATPLVSVKLRDGKGEARVEQTGRAAVCKVIDVTGSVAFEGTVGNFGMRLAPDVCLDTTALTAGSVLSIRDFMIHEHAA